MRQNAAPAGPLNYYIMKGSVDMKNSRIEEIYYAEVFDIPVNMILPNPDSARKYFDSMKMNALIRTISQYGVIQPITVREKGDMYQLISGERRLRGAIAAGLEYIPGIIVEADDNKSAIMTLLENLQREDLCFFEVAESYKNLLRKQGLTQEELAKKIGMSPSAVSNKMRLLRLPPKVKKLIRDYGLTERHARAVLALPDEETQLSVVRKIHAERLNVSDSEHLVDEVLAGKREKLKTTTSGGETGLFSNTVKRAVEIMKKNGINADMESQDHEWGSRFIIDLRKQ